MRRIVSRTSIALLVCAFFVCVFCALSLPTIWKQSMTGDEAPILAGSYLASFKADFRVNKEDPPLLKYFVGLTMSKDSLRPGEIDSVIDRAGGIAVGQGMGVDRMFGVEWSRVEELNRRGRLVVFVFGLLLGIGVVGWTWRLAGGRAAIIASILFAFEPTLLGHSPLVKGDVLISLIFLWMMISTWFLCERITALRVVSLGLLCGLALSAKCTGVLLLPVPMIALSGRALARHRWDAIGIALKTRGQRLLVVTGIGLISALLIAAVIWSAYQFRFSASADPRALDQFPATLAYTMVQERRYEAQRDPAHGESEVWHPGLPLRGAIFLHDHRLLPEAWISGVLNQRGMAFTWPNYLLGRIYEGPCWYYFPLAIAVKEPMALVLVLSVAIFALLRRSVWRKWWFLILPIVWYGVFAVRSPMDIGIRHLLPVFAFALIGSAITLDWVLRQFSPAKAIALASLFFLLLAGEVIFAFPHYISFFNLAGRAADPLYLLGDSNLDWGQDLPLLAKWQREHPGKELYLSFFGPSSPGAYGITAHDLLAENLPAHRAVVAVSATNLQGMYLRPWELAKIEPLRRMKPTQILGGTIYIYQWEK